MDIIGTVTGLPKWARIALAVAAALILFGTGWTLWLHFHDKGVVEADRAKSNAAAVSQARTADESAQRAAQGKSQEVENGNDNARRAAEGSDDPLADGLRSLHPGTH